MNVWLAAMRPKTLGASLCPVLMGGALAAHDGVFSLMPVVAAFVGACLLQIASNFANDLFDGLRGTDSVARLGPQRAVGSGLVSARAMVIALGLALALAAIPAGYLALHSGAAFAWIGLVGAIAAVGYTAPPLSLAYRGLGDIFVFLFFGPLAVAGTRAACDGQWTSVALVCGLAPGAIGVCLLATNNLRDRVGDAASGKRTLAVRFGEQFARWQISACYWLAFVLPILAPFVFGLPRGVMLATLVAIPLDAARPIFRGRDGAELNRSLAMFGALLYVYGVAFAIGMQFNWGNT